MASYAVCYSVEANLGRGKALAAPGSGQWRRLNWRSHSLANFRKELLVLLNGAPTFLAAGARMKMRSPEKAPPPRSEPSHQKLQALVGQTVIHRSTSLFLTDSSWSLGHELLNDGLELLQHTVLVGVDCRRRDPQEPSDLAGVHSLECVEIERLVRL